MPIYEYVCDDCGAEYERIVLNGSTEVTCPKCSSTKSTMQLSVFAAHGNGAKTSGGSSSSSSSSGGGCCGGACGCR
ncbi:MAG TPA: zinc ribbon domain-containing protein [Candidatus Acidoferrales bacterium]|nr:zinc ribbon domain-containing protein [Candidatus Acidoferrales bacterium]